MVIDLTGACASDYVHWCMYAFVTLCPWVCVCARACVYAHVCMDINNMCICVHMVYVCACVCVLPFDLFLQCSHITYV